MRINQNIYALNAQRNLQITNNRLAVSLERLSSGLRINRASDDAAGLAISEKLRAQVSGLGVSIDNANDGISLIRTAEGALDRVNAILKRMRDLVGWAANGDKTDADRQKYQDEINQLISEINRISTTTEYNTKKLLNGQLGTKATIDTNAYSNIVENNAIGIAGVIGGTGTYQVSVATAGQANYTAIGLGTTATIPVTMSLATVLGYTTGDAFTKSITVSQADGKSATVTLTITTGATGDTIETTLNKLNTAFTNAGMQVRAEFDSTTNEIKLMSQEVGSKYNVTWIESNSIANAPTFTGAYQLTTLGLQSVGGASNIGEYYTLDEALNFSISNGSTSLVMVTFGAITEGTTLRQALNLNGQMSLTFSLNIGSDVVKVVATDGMTVGALVSALDSALSTYGVDVVFDDDNDAIRFVYSDTSTRVTNYSVDINNVTTTALSAITFGIDVTSGTTLSTALTMGGAGSVTVSLLIDGTTVTISDLSDTSTINDLVNTLNSNLSTYGITALFDDANDKITFTSSNPNYLIFDITFTTTVGHDDPGENYATPTIGTAGTELNYTVGVLTFTLTLGNDQTIVLTASSDTSIDAFITKLNSSLTGYGLSATASIDDTNNAIVFNYQAGSTKIESLSVTSGGTLTYSTLSTFNSTDKVSAASVDVTILVTDPVTNTSKTVTSTSREFAAGTGGPNVSVDSSGISGVTFKLTKDAASTTGTYFEFDLSKGSITLQIGPNAGTDHRMEISINDMSANALGVSNINVTDQASAQAIIDAQTIDKAIELVVTERGKLGAYENRLNHTIQNLGVAKENLTSAESRLRDADLAAEMMEFTRNQIMLQAGTAMLAQANTVPQTVLQLLR